MDELGAAQGGRLVRGRTAARTASARHRLTALGALLAAALVTTSTLVVWGPSPVASAHASHSQLTRARNALLVLADMPAGWVKAKNTNSNNNIGSAQLARCMGVSQALIDENPPSVNSPQFQNRQGTLIVNDNVTVFPSVKNAAAELAIVANPKTPTCMTQLASGPLKTKLFGTLPKDVSLGTPLVSPTSASAFGANTPGFSLSVPITTRGVTVNVTVTQLSAVKGLYGQQITFTAIGDPFSIPLEQRITASAVGRL